MASLNFIYGTMECGKTTKLVQDAYNYSKHGQKVIIVKPKVDTKGGSKIVSRMSETLECDILLDKDESIFDDVNLKKIVDAKTILVDEAQFLTHDQVFDFWKIAHVMNIHVVCYGLKSDFSAKLFTGSSALFGLADNKTELTVNCECGNVAVFNARKVNGDYIFKGEQIVIDDKAEVEYVPLCSDCYLKYVVGESEYKNLKTNKKKTTKKKIENNLQK